VQTLLVKRVLTVLLALGAAAGAIICLAVTAATFVLRRPIEGIGVLLIPGIPVLIAGQLAMMAIWRSNRRNSTETPRWASFTEFRRLFTGLPGPAAAFFIALCLGGWLAGMTTFGAASQGEPVASATAPCQHRHNEHGTITCQSQRQYERAGVVNQRFAAGFLLSAFSVHTGVLLSAAMRQRIRHGTQFRRAAR
jgi:hypothetical protein